MDPGYIDFNVNLGKWNASQKVPVMNDLSSLSEALLLARATQGADAVLEEALRKIVDGKALDTALEDARGAKDVGHALTTLSSRKWGKALAALTEQEGWQAKEKKMVQEMLRLYATRSLCRAHGIELHYDKSNPAWENGKLGLEEGTIQFIANYSAWKCIKKFKVEKTTNRRTVAEFMASYMITMDLRFEEYLRTLTDLKTLESALANAPTKGTPIPRGIEFLSQSSITQAIQKAAGKNADAIPAIRAYAYRKVLKGMGQMVDYTQIKSLPGWKRVIGKRK